MRAVHALNTIASSDSGSTQAALAAVMATCLDNWLSMCKRVSPDLQWSFHIVECEAKKYVLEPGAITCAASPCAMIACSTNMWTASPFNHSLLQHDCRASSTRPFDTFSILPRFDSYLLKRTTLRSIFNINIGQQQQQQPEISKILVHPDTPPARVFRYGNTAHPHGQSRSSLYTPSRTTSNIGNPPLATNKIKMQNDKLKRQNVVFSANHNL